MFCLTTNPSVHGGGGSEGTLGGLVEVGRDAEGHIEDGHGSDRRGGEHRRQRFVFNGYNKTGEGVVQLSVDDYGNGVVGAYNRKGKGRTLESR